MRSARLVRRSVRSLPAGQKIVFLPNSWGNEQLPLLFVAVNCDMRYSVAMTNGGAVCIHAKLEDDKTKAKEGAPATGKEK